MDKQQLMALISSLPDELEVVPFEYTESSHVASEWEPQFRHTQIGGVYQRDVSNELTLRLRFKTREQGEFRRSYADPDGTFFNLHNVR